MTVFRVDSDIIIMRNKIIVRFVVRHYLCAKVGANGIAYTNPLGSGFYPNYV
jgi:hypothetical protein